MGEGGEEHEIRPVGGGSRRGRQPARSGEREGNGNGLGSRNDRWGEPGGATGVPHQRGRIYLGAADHYGCDGRRIRVELGRAPLVGDQGGGRLWRGRWKEAPPPS